MLSREERWFKLLDQVVAWADERNFKDGATLQGQQCKGEEELGELFGHMLESLTGIDTLELIKDDIGDGFVVAIIQAHMSNLTPSAMFVCPKENISKFSNMEQLLIIGFTHSKIAHNICKGRFLGIALKEFITELATLASTLGLDPVDCLETAYMDIKDRGGEWRNGTFVKEADL